MPRPSKKEREYREFKKKTLAEVREAVSACPYCGTAGASVEAGENLVRAFACSCGKCGKRYSVFDNGFRLYAHSCRKCGSFETVMKHPGGMTPCNWECRSCGNVASNGDVGYHGFVAPESYHAMPHWENG